MIGNNKYIADIMSKNPDGASNDVHEIEMILNEYWRYVKYLQKYTNDTSINLPFLGRFDYKMGKGNLTIRHFDKQLAKLRASKHYEEGSEKVLAFIKLFQDQLDASLKQKETLSEVFRLRNERWAKKKAEREANNSNSENTTTENIDNQ